MLLYKSELAAVPTAEYSLSFLFSVTCAKAQFGSTYSFIHQNSVSISLLPHACHIPCPSHPDFQIMCCDNYKPRSYSLCSVLHSPVTSCQYQISSSTHSYSLCSVLHSPVTSSQYQISSSAHCCGTPSACVLRLMWETKFHIHIKSQTNIHAMYKCQ